MASFKIDDYVENRLRAPGLTQGGIYCILDIKTGYALNHLGYNHPLFYPIIRDDRGRLIPIHPDYLRIVPPSSFSATFGGASEYEEIMESYRLMEEG